MLLKEKSFHGSSSYVEKHRKLRMEAGSASWFPEFKLVNLNFLPILHKLLFIFFQFQLYCVLSGKFVYHIAGLVRNIPHLSVFVVLNESPLVEFIFRKYPDIGETFSFQSFKFRLIETNSDVCTYELTSLPTRYMFEHLFTQWTAFWIERTYDFRRVRICCQFKCKFN